MQKTKESHDKYLMKINYKNFNKKN